MATAVRIDGKAKAAELSEKITAETAALESEHGVKPGLAVVIIGAVRGAADVAARI